MTLQSNKTLGGVGALLMVISPFLVSGFTLLAGLVGLILVLIAVKGLSDHYKEASIFNNSLYGVILSIVGVVVFVAALFVTALSFFTNVLGIELSAALSDPTAFSNIDWTEAMILDNLMAHVAALVGSLVILFIFVVVAAIFYRKSLTTLAEKTGVGLFGTAGLLLLIGAVLTIIVIGFLLIWVALILLTAAFFKIRAEPTQPPPMTPS
ncbi:MAG: DUF996 domain-containing protein [Candidatus Bathyarchaeota archaeon]|nr:DUF996 domain-containing protein [Candidatus Bathyarchaeota archaeon]